MSKIIEFEIPLVAPSLNQWYAGGHWGSRSKVVNEWHLAIHLLVKQLKIKPIKKFPVIITSISYFKTNRRRDSSNYITANKLAEDGLVKAGILPDDSFNFVNESRVMAPVGGCKKEKTIIRIELA